jgi:hypothetical protein
MRGDPESPVDPADFLLRRSLKSPNLTTRCSLLNHVIFAH